MKILLVSYIKNLERFYDPGVNLISDGRGSGSFLSVQSFLLSLLSTMYDVQWYTFWHTKMRYCLERQ